MNIAKSPRYQKIKKQLIKEKRYELLQEILDLVNEITCEDAKEWMKTIEEVRILWK